MPAPRISPWKLSLFGALGAVAPEVVLFYSKRFAMEGVTFQVWQYAVVSILYLGLAAVVAAIFPYPGKPTPWKAFVVGTALPVIISTAASFAQGTTVVPRGQSIEGTLLDLIAFF
jgi:hypothetical protein